MDTDIVPKSVALQRLMGQSRNGSNSFYRHPLVRRFLYTDGVREVAELAGAYWLLDIIATETIGLPQWIAPQGSGIVRVVSANGKADIDLTFVDGAPPVWTRHIDITDFPEGEWAFELNPVDYEVGAAVLALSLITEH
jgi:hypothetical protein